MHVRNDHTCIQVSWIEAIVSRIGFNIYLYTYIQLYIFPQQMSRDSCCDLQRICLYIYTHALYILKHIWKDRYCLLCAIIMQSCRDHSFVCSRSFGALEVPRGTQISPQTSCVISEGVQVGRASGRRCLEVGPVLFSKFAIINQLQIPSFLG